MQDRLSRSVDLYRLDRKFGISTRRTDVTHKGDENQGYMGTNPKHFAAMLHELPIDRATFSFVDLGCGKGTALFLAAEAGFRRVIGVELVPGLLEAARDNVWAFEARDPSRAARIELVQHDAGTYELPSEPTVLFLFNPFGPETLRKVVSKIEAWLTTQRHSIYVLYQYIPDVATEILAESEALQLMHSVPVWSIYRNVEFSPPQGRPRQDSNLRPSD